MEGRRDLESPDEELERDFDQSNCFPVLDEGFQYKKTFIKMNKKLSGTVAFRLKTNVTRALLKENSCGECQTIYLRTLTEMKPEPIAT